MPRISRLIMICLSALFLTAALSPVRAAGLPIAAGSELNQAAAIESTAVQYRGRHGWGRPYGYRPYHGARYYGPRYYGPRYYGAPVYWGAPTYYYGAPVYSNSPVYVGRRCYNRVRWVRTAHGKVRRVVRVCRW